MSTRISAGEALSVVRSDEGSRDGTQGSRRLHAMAIAAIACLYLATLAVNHNEAEDSVLYIRIVTRGPVAALFLPNHLLFNALNRAAYWLWRALGYRGNAELPMEINNLLAATAGLFLMQRLARRLGLRPASVIGAVTATALSFGFWWYAVEAETCTLPIPLILLTLDRTMTIARSPTPRNFTILGLLSALLILLHEQHLLVPMVLWAVILGVAWARRREVRMGAFLRGGALGAAVVAIPVVSAYAAVAVFLWHKRTVRAALLWALGHAAHGAWTPWSWSNPAKSLVGFGRAITGLHMMFGFERFDRLIARLFPGQLLFEERYLVRGMPAWELALYVALLVGALGAAAALLRATIGTRRRRALDLEAKVFVWAAWSLLAAYAVFNTVWEPQNVEFWIATVPIAHLLVARRLDAVADSTAVRRLLTAYVICLGLSNLIGSILPMNRQDRDYWYAMNLPLIQQAKAGDTILTDGGYISHEYLALYTDAEVLDAGALDPQSLTPLLAPGARRRLFVSSWVFAPPRELSASRLSRREAIIALLRPHEASWREVGRTEAQVVWEWIP